jgi:hypothetical protein
MEWREVALKKFPDESTFLSSGIIQVAKICYVPVTVHQQIPVDLCHGMKTSPTIYLDGCFFFLSAVRALGYTFSI